MTMPIDDGFPWLGRLLQVSDSAFPTGGYAHSGGFEQIVQLGLVRDAASLTRYLDEHLWPMLIHFEMPILRDAANAAVKNDLADLLALDACLDAGKAPRELRESSRAMGGRRLHAFSDNAMSPALTAFSQAVKDGRTPGHHAVVFGLGLAGMPSRALLSSWAFQSLSAVCLSAPKLLRIGQDSVRRVLAQALLPMEENVTHALTIDRDEIGWFDPLVDLASMQHEITHERLFIS